MVDKKKTDLNRDFLYRFRAKNKPFYVSNRDASANLPNNCQKVSNRLVLAGGGEIENSNMRKAFGDVKGRKHEEILQEDSSYRLFSPQYSLINLLSYL